MGQQGGGGGGPVWRRLEVQDRQGVNEQRTLPSTHRPVVRRSWEADGEHARPRSWLSDLPDDVLHVVLGFAIHTLTDLVAGNAVGHQWARVAHQVPLGVVRRINVAWIILCVKKPHGRLRAYLQRDDNGWLRTLPLCLRNHQADLSIDLSGVSIHRHILDSLCAILHSAPRVHTLGLGRAYLRPQQLQLVLDSPVAATLESLDLSSNVLQSIGMERVALLLCHSRTLHSLTLWDADLGPGALLRLLRAAPHCQTLTHLDLGRVPFPTRWPAHCLLGSLTQVGTLILQGTGLGAQGLQDLGALLRTPSPRLQVLDIGFNKITTEALGTLASALHGHPTLRGLQLNRNAFGDEGWAALGPAVGAMPALRELGMACTQLHSPHSLVHVLRTHTALTAVDLQYNDLALGFAQELAALERERDGLHLLYPKNLFLNDSSDEDLSSLSSVDSDA